MANQPTSKTPNSSTNTQAAGSPSKSQDTVRVEGKGSSQPTATIKAGAPATNKPATAKTATPTTVANGKPAANGAATNGTKPAGANGTTAATTKAPAQAAKLPQAKPAGQVGQPGVQGKPAVAATMTQASATMTQPRPGVAAQGRPAVIPGGIAVQAEQPTSAVDALEDLNRAGSMRFSTLAACMLISLMVNMLLVLICALIVMPEEFKDQFNNLVASPGEKTEELQEITPLEEQKLDTSTVESVPLEQPVTSVDVAPAEVATAQPVDIKFEAVGLQTAPRNDLLSKAVTAGGQGVDGRSEASRAQLVAARGGTSESEAAVARALEWLANHQDQSDGSWCFDHRAGQCAGRCATPGEKSKAKLAATGMALLPMLGAGQTHKQGKYKKNVMAGLMYLANNMKVGPNGGDMTGDGGALYGHGICSIALTEAYAMTQDRGLMQPAQFAINYICYAQDDVGGGWRYSPKQAGDTSVVGWQLMALKSGHLGYLQVPPQVIKNATKFLDSVQADGGAGYGYTAPGKGPATTAVGLLCRMYLGMKHEDPGLEKGVQYLSKLGPSPGNMYFNYYATQVLHHYEGEHWDKWNNKMRDSLVASQSKTGHESGSWVFTGDHGSQQGGRLYCTAMATMILEVYYRHLPIYKKRSTEDDFDK
jgi:hypothetical protein